MLDDTGDAQRPGETQQVGQVAEGTAQENGPAESTVHGLPDGGDLRRVVCRLLPPRGGGNGEKMADREHATRHTSLIQEA